MLKNKKGSIYIEGSLVMPLTCLIAVSLIGIAMYFHGNIIKQIETHDKAFVKYEGGYEARYVREYDGINKIFEQLESEHYEE